MNKYKKRQGENCIKVCILSIALAFISGCSEENNSHPMLGKVLWQETDFVKTETRIKSIKLTHVACNKLTLEVSYHNNGSLGGYLSMKSNAHIQSQKWPMIPKMKVGDRTIQVQNGYQRGGKTAYSDELSVSINHYQNNSWRGYIDKVSIPFDKKWNHSCVRS